VAQGEARGAAAWGDLRSSREEVKERRKGEEAGGGRGGREKRGDN
jgi:hypothetical protein